MSLLDAHTHGENPKAEERVLEGLGGGFGGGEGGSFLDRLFRDGIAIFRGGGNRLGGPIGLGPRQTTRGA